jgi:exonuclease VII small subunit
MPILKLIPLETKIAILLLVFLPAISVIYLRFSLYKGIGKLNKQIDRASLSHLQENSQAKIDNKSSELASSIGLKYEEQINIVEKLESRYKKASDKLDNVNTIALIDSLYKEEKIIFLWREMTLDWADAFTNTLPNLLIAFGLIGTFWGITSNLTNISSVVTSFSQSNPDVGKLVQGLESPLQDMGIAFSTSLFGLLCGSLLTVINTWWNTSIAKHQLISSLEDYLDNICNKGNTRLDLAIKTMVNQQKEFLDRFHENVGRVLAASFGAAAENITKECYEANKLAINVYTKLDNAAGTIATGASTFQYAAKSLESQTKNIANSLNEFKSGVDTFKIAANKIEQNNIVQNLDRVLAELNNSQQAFAASTITLQGSLIGITTSNQTAAQLAQQVYQTWQDSTTQMVAASETIGAGAIIFQKSADALETQTQTFLDSIPQLKSGIDTFAAAANKVKTNNIIKHLNSLVENLSTTQSAFTSSTQTLATSVEGITSSHYQTNQTAERVYQGLEKTTSSIQSGANNFMNAAQIIRDSSLATDLASVANKWQNAQSEFTNSTTIFSQASTNLQPVAAKLEPAIASIDRAVNSLQQVGSEVVSLSKNTVQVSESAQNALDEFNRNYLKVLNNTDLSIQDLGTTNRANWQTLVDILERKIQADRTQNLQSIEAMKEHFTQMSLPDPASLARLLAILEKLEHILNNNKGIDSSGSNDGKSGLLGRSQRN